MNAVSGVVRVSGPRGFIVTYRTCDGGRHRFEHASRDVLSQEVRGEVARRISERHALSHVVPGSLTIQQVRR